MNHASETIAAIATPPGAGGVGIVRVSGPLALAIGRALFRPAATGFRDFEPRKLHLGEVLGPGGLAVDQALVVAMPGPGSYTGEDVVEFQCHGGPAVLAQVLEAVLARGARPAQPGEFTRRAFMAGRIDLSQAEAVAELTMARTPATAELARARLSGALRATVDNLREALLALRVQLCAAVDFPDEDIDCLPPEVFAAEVQRVGAEIDVLLAAHQRSRIWREGAAVVLAGPVNAGKSSLMNALLGRQRALVSHTPGTTRDYLEEGLMLDGLAVRILDTAGLREADPQESGLRGSGLTEDGPATRGPDAVEQAGMERSRELMADADLVLLVHDASLPAAQAELALAKELAARGRGLAVINKVDLPHGPAESTAKFYASGLPTALVSAATGAGVEALAATIRGLLLGQSGAGSMSEPQHGQLTPNLRQAQALTRAGEELDGLRLDITAGLPYDLLGVRLEAACAALAEITGHMAPEAVLDAVFGTFCIGK